MRIEVHSSLVPGERAVLDGDALVLVDVECVGLLSVLQSSGVVEVAVVDGEVRSCVVGEDRTVIVDGLVLEIHVLDRDVVGVGSEVERVFGELGVPRGLAGSDQSVDHEGSVGGPGECDLLFRSIVLQIREDLDGDGACGIFVRLFGRFLKRRERRRF